MLTNRWTTLIHHPVQQAYWKSLTRFNISHAGRRSGKTELAKRKLVKKAISCLTPQGRFVLSAPTHRQATKIFWDDVKALVPRWALQNGLRSISESYRTIRLKNGTQIEIIGLDAAERIEGPPLDGFVGDEFGNFKPTVWAQNIRPALSTLGRPGWADLIGVPEGKNHYFTLVEDAKQMKDWSVFTWETYEINPDEAKDAETELDELTFNQEYKGQFISFKGITYYSFDKERHVGSVKYNPDFPLILCHDFNRIPGTCVICQEQPSPDWLKVRQGSGEVTAVIGEVFLKQDSTTEKVCQILKKDWGHHKGEVHLYGDASGGAKTSQGVRGSDWDIIQAQLASWDLRIRYPKANPHIRVRINSVNSRLKSADNKIHVIIDPTVKMLVRDFEGVTCNDAGEIEKNEAMLTHISDGFGYYITKKFHGTKMSRQEV